MMLLRGFIGLVPWQAWALAGVLAAAWVWHWNDKREAVSAYSEALVRKGEKLESAADRAALSVAECYARGGRWNKDTHTCAQ